ncbi:MAG: isoprenylcysteine carboxylmethyltransferase family protein [Terracidiphilus sp.]
MKKLYMKAIAGLLGLLAFLSAATFLSAWTLHYWQAWTCLAVFFASAVAITIYLAKRDPELLARRMKAGPSAEEEKSQKIIQSFTRVLFLSLFIVPALDHRFGWSRVPAAASIAGDTLIVIGFAIVFLVFKENTYTSGVIEVAAGQSVISTGPYAVARHPMYSGALLMLSGIPLALGSWWGLLLFPPMGGAIVWRLLDEEKFLAVNLPGYSEYQARVTYRLLPFIW